MHVDRAGHERRLAADGDRQRMERIVDRAGRRALGHLAQRRGGRILPLGQAVNAVVEQHDVDVEVAADAVHQVIAADRQPVAVAGDDPHRQIGPAGFQARGHGRRPAVDRVDAVGVHVIGKPAGAADAGDEHHLFRRHAERRQHLLHLGQNRIVAAAGAPANVLIAGKILRRSAPARTVIGSSWTMGDQSSVELTSAKNAGLRLSRRMTHSLRAIFHQPTSLRIFATTSRHGERLALHLVQPDGVDQKHRRGSAAAIGPGSVPESALVRSA